MKFLLYFIIAMVTFSSCCTIKPNAPNPTPQQIAFDPPPLSKVILPVSVDFSGKIPELQQTLQQALTIDDGQNDCNLTYSYSVRNNAPLNLSFLQTPGNPLKIATQLQVGAGATFCALCVNFFGRRCVVPKISASCGQGEPLRRIQVGVSTVLGVNPNYSLRANTRLDDLFFIDPCRVTFLNINISGIIESKARSRVPLGSLDQRVGTISIRPQALQLWNKLNENLQIDNGLFLKIHPTQLSLSNITGINQTANIRIGLEATPEIVTDGTIPPALPLPDLQPVTGTSGFNIFSDINLDYKYISDKITSALKKNTIDVAGKKIKIKKVQALATNNRELILKVFFKGDVCGYVYVLGVPVYDPLTGDVKLTNIKYDVLTSSFLLNVAAWLLQPIVTTKLEEKAKFPIKTFIDNNVNKLNPLLKKDYPNGVSTDGKINSISIVPNNFHALPQFFHIRMHALGDLGVTVRL